MSTFGGFGGGFGQQNNNQQQQQQQPSGFGGFGTNTNTNTAPGFGTANNNAFGANTNTSTGGGLFGSSTGGTGGFGSAGGFGSTNNAFGAKPAFGSTNTTSGGLFGSTPTPSSNAGFGGGGFGSNTAQTSTSFGSTGTTLFGSNKPFGTGTGTGTGTPGSTSLFGSGGGFSTGSGSTFGAANNPGIGTNIGEPPGTGVVPYQPTIEKEPANPSQSNKFESILFMDAYKKWSADELRLADYAKGQKTGTTGGTGAFGGTGFGSTGFATTTQNPGFGGTGTTSGGVFGNAQTAPSGFGSTATGTGGFGSAGGLFGQNKPASTSLFGNNTSQPTQSGGIFGTGSGAGGFGNTTNTGGGFGSAQPAAAGGIFGSNADQNKPSGFSFGNTGTNTGGFGSTTTNNAFNNNTGTGLFGNAGASGGGVFGNAGQQQAPTSGFGSGFGSQTQNTGSNLFGNQQQKPGGLFGGGNATNTSTGLFGNSANASNPFGGGSTAAQTGGGIFGAKPNTAASGGIFGNTNTAQQGTSGTGLFGNLGSTTQNQTNTAGGMFGGLGQNQQQKPSIFASSTQSTGGGIFGNNNQQQSGGLFPASQAQQQPQASGFGNSIFGTPQNAQSTPQSLSTSINDISAFGATSLFSNLGGSEVPNPGPLATPLSGNVHKARSRSILPMYKLSPANSSAFVTPQRRGFGFSYSNFGTPNSPSSVASTPSKMGQGFLMGSISRGLNKSISASNLRRTYNVEDSILPSGAFSASSGTRYYGSAGSHKKLIINREMRSDLFSSPSRDKQPAEPVNNSRKLSKRVSFEASAGGAVENGVDGGEQQPSDEVTTTAQDLGYLRPTGRTPNGGVNGSKAAKNGGTTETEQVKGKELAIVHEEESPVPAPRASSSEPGNEAGEYWTQPSREEIESMNRVQRQKVSDFTIGRENVGSIQFKFPVDLSNINLDELFGGIVDLAFRAATVYPNPAKKPPVGKGLNVPAVISLEQSWPRDRSKKALEDKSGARLNRHVERLKKIPNTTFISYDKDTGVWTFSVEHFTTYGLDDDEDEDDDEDGTKVSEKNGAELAVPHGSGFPRSGTDMEAASADGDAEDAYPHRAKRRAVPGAFDGGDESTDEGEDVHAAQPAFRSSPQGMNEASHHDDMLAVQAAVDDEGNDSYLYEAVGMDVEHETPDLDDMVGPQQVPGGILRARMKAVKESTMPQKIKVAGGDDWTEALQKRVNSLRRTDRATLRAMGEQVAVEEEYEQTGEVSAQMAGGSLMMSKQQRVVSDGAGFATSIDLMNSLFDKAKASGPRVQASPARGFVKWPYERQAQGLDAAEMDSTEKAFRKSVRPCWGPNGTLVYGSFSASPKTAEGAECFCLFTFSTASDTSEQQQQQQLIHVVRLADPASAIATSKAIEAHTALQPMTLVKGVPTTTPRPVASIRAYFDEKSLQGPSATHEKNIWEVASILFDEAPGGTNTTLTEEVHARRAKMSAFWEKLVEEDCSRSVAMAKSNEEKAIASLAGHRIDAACKYLLEGKNYRLATLVALIGTSRTVARDLQEQIRDWKESNAMSEISEPIRALYELVAGNVCLCTGKQGKQGASIENRTSSFVISQRFGLNWKQAFGLRLWYGSAAGDDISAAVELFDKDISQGREPAPLPWYAQDGIPTAWNHANQSDGEDELWSLLKLHVDREADLSSVLCPRNVSLTPFDTRLTWQLGRALIDTGRFTLPPHNADAATLAFAEQLTAQGHWIVAVWALSHLSPNSRGRAIQEHLARYTGKLVRTPPAWRELRGQAWLPRNWAYEALALWARAVEKDGVMELDFLRKAGNYREAHRALVTKVGPQAVIERDYGLLGLADVLEKHTVEIPDWNMGGAMYAAYRQFWLGLKRSAKGHSGQVSVDLVDRLLEMLRELKRQDVDMEMQQRAAVRLMAVQLAEVRQDCVRA